MYFYTFIFYILFLSVEGLALASKEKQVGAATVNVISEEGVTVNVPKKSTPKPNITEKTSERAGREKIDDSKEILNTLKFNSNKTKDIDDLVANLPVNIRNDSLKVHETIVARKEATLGNVLPTAAINTSFSDIHKNVTKETSKNGTTEERQFLNLKAESPATPTSRDNARKYIVLVVGIIFSLPLIGVLIAYSLKRGTDWWQHRHYRRMDFLIEGMYNN